MKNFLLLLLSLLIIGIMASCSKSDKKPEKLVLMRATTIKTNRVVPAYAKQNVADIYKIGDTVRIIRSSGIIINGSDRDNHLISEEVILEEDTYSMRTPEQNVKLDSAMKSIKKTAHE